MKNPELTNFLLLSSDFGLPTSGFIFQDFFL